MMLYILKSDSEMQRSSARRFIQLALIDNVRLFVCFFFSFFIQDLFTVMIQGPCRTPYEDGLFFFDVQLPNDYPNSPPVFFYISYCTDRLNPNLYEDGKVCVSLLGTWTGKVLAYTMTLFFEIKFSEYL